MHDDYSAFDGDIGETIEVMVVHDEDESEGNSASISHTNRLLSYEELCDRINEEEKLRQKSYIRFGYKGRLTLDIVLIILIVITYVFTNPFTNIESSDPVWKMVLSMIFTTLCAFGFYFTIKTFKKDWRVFSMYRYKKWLERYYQ